VAASDTTQEQGVAQAGPAAPAALELPPPRESWEEPPDRAWASHLGGLGRETMALAMVLAAAAGVWYLFGVVIQLHAEPGASSAGLAFLWIVIGGLAALSGAFVVRRIEGLALMVAMFTDYGRVARLGGRPPVWLDDPPEGGLKLAHLSDLHVTEGEQVRMVERAVAGGNQRLAELLRRPELADTDAVVITGDITDRGTAAAWKCALDLIGGAGLADRVILVPGNHDLAIIHPWGHTWRRNDRFGIVQLANLLKFCESFAATGGGRHGKVWNEERAVPYQEAWAAAEQAVRPLVTALHKEPVPRQRLGKGYLARRDEVIAYASSITRARHDLLALFPIAVPIAGKDAVVFVLNSCTPISRHPATNALGWVGRAQYRRLDRLARGFAEPLKLVALHHHVVRRVEEQSRDLKSRIFAKFTVLGDSGPLVKFCRRHRVRAVMNGHRHLSYQVRLPSGTVLMAAPSSTLGDELARDPRPQFERYDLAPFIEEPTVGIYRRSVRVSRPRS
jgi:3',5'-cyclic AMP phosphodiesterase CpdA